MNNLDILRKSHRSRIFGVIYFAFFPPMYSAPPAGYSPTFADEFSGTALDSTVWQVEASRPNAAVANGSLVLTTKLLADGTTFQTGGIATTQFTQRFGYYEARIQIDKSVSGLNNAFWLNTPTWATNNTIDRMEFDIAEISAYPPADRVNIGSNIHDWAPTHVGYGYGIYKYGYSTDYHTYALEWTENNTINHYLDGVLISTGTSNIVTESETFIPETILLTSLVSDSTATGLNGSRMSVDYVRVYDKPGFNGAIDGNWDSNGNWGSGHFPATGEAAIFNRPVVTAAITVAGANKAATEVYFDNPALPALTISPRSDSPAAFLLIGTTGHSGGICINSQVSTPQTFAIPITAAGSLRLNNFSSTALLKFTKPLSTQNAGDELSMIVAEGGLEIADSIQSTFGPLNIYGKGIVRLEAANAYTGTTSLIQGTLVVTADGALGATGTGASTVVSSGATLGLAGGVNYTTAEIVHLSGTGATGAAGALDVEDSSSVGFGGFIVMDAAATIGSGSGNGTLTLANDLDTTAGAFKLTFAGSGTTIMNGAISGAGALTKAGTGTLWLNGLVSTGVTTVTQGTLITNLAALAGSVVNSGTVIYNEAIDRTATNNWGGAGTYIKQGAGTLTVAGAMSTTGVLELQGGTLKLGASERFSSSLDLIVDTGATVDLNAFSETLGPVVLNGGSIVNSTGSSSQSLIGASYEVRSGTVSARLGGGGISLTKTTGGTVILSGANTFTGGTTVQAGTLDLAGSLNSSVTVTGGTLTLGSTTGTRTVNGSLTANASSTLRFRINGTTAGTQYDQLRLTNAASTLTLAGTLDLVAAPGLPAGSTFRIIDNSGSTTAITGTFAGLPEGAQFYEDGQWWSISYMGGTGNDVLLTRITPTPKQTWLGANFGTNANDPSISGDLADPDHDGICNLLEYATAMNPNVSDTLPTQINRTATTLDFVYTKNKAATDLTYTVEWSDTLANDWSTSGLSAPTVLSDNGSTQQIKVTLPMGAGVTKRFMRLKVTRP